MSLIPKPQEIYKHFKGGLYQVITVAEHSETGEQLVVYQALYGNFKIYARPLSLFTDRVDRDKYPEAVQEFRFELQSGESGDGGRNDCGKSDAEEDRGEQYGGGTSMNVSKQKMKQQGEQEAEIDPLVLEFLDADTYEKRLNILTGLHHRITDEMITTMAIACDVEVEEGDTEERYESLKTCLLTLQKYECNRLR